MVFFFFWVFCAVIVGLIGSNRTIGFWATFLLSILLSPVIALIIALCYQSKSSAYYQQQMLIQQQQATQAIQNLHQKDPTTTEIERLAKLKADGVISEEEFQKLKAKLIS